MKIISSITIKLRWFVIVLVCLPATAQAQGDVARWTVEVAQHYRFVPDLTYLIADGYELKLDVIGPRDVSKPLPTLLHFHGSGWIRGNKAESLLHFLSYLEMGFAIVNVGYRLAPVALAPAAVEDCRCALLWLIRNAKEYGFDTDRIVADGFSTGGHLALTTGMLPVSAGFDRRCATSDFEGEKPADLYEPQMSVAAIVNFFGVTDVADLIEGPNAKMYAVRWMGAKADWRDVAQRVSPIKYVRPDLPPILTIHGDSDLLVPYQHAVRLHKALDKAGVPNKLHTISRGGHGGFTLDEDLKVAQVIRSFLHFHGVLR